MSESEFAAHTPKSQLVIELSYRFGNAQRPTRLVTGPVPQPASAPTPALPTAVTPTATEPVPPTLGIVSGLVLDDLGHPASNARISLTSKETTVHTTSNTAGHFVFEKAPLGAAELSIESPRFNAYAKEIEVHAAGPEIRAILSLAEVPAELRGQIMSHTGQILRATLTILPDGTRLESDDDGTFRHVLGPGVYQVRIEADGYISQERTLEIQTSSVSILNIEMKRRR